MLISNRDLSKMVDYYKKGSNPVVLANTVKDLEKAKARFVIANAMDWDEATSEFLRRCQELGIDEDSLNYIKDMAASYELPDEFKRELEEGPSKTDAQRLRSWFPRLFNVLRSHCVNGFKLEGRAPVESELEIDRRNGRCYTLAYTLKFPYRGRDVELKISNHSNEGGGSYGVSSPTLNIYQSTQSELADKAGKYLDELPEVASNIKHVANSILEGANIRESLSAFLTEAPKKNINVKQLEVELDDALKQYMTSEGFPEDEIKDYSRITVTDTPDKVIIEVGAELSYDGLMDLSDALDKVVAKYDKDAYFDAEDAGLLSAYIFK